jgi:hypothetical protein
MYVLEVVYALSLGIMTDTRSECKGSSRHVTLRPQRVRCLANHIPDLLWGDTCLTVQISLHFVTDPECSVNHLLQYASQPHPDT